jgi:signal transduction histidine kinase
MTRSLHRTLAVRFAATMGVGLAAASASLYWATTKVMNRELDQSLAGGSFLGGAAVAAVPAAAGSSAADSAHFGRAFNRYVVLRAAGGAVLRALPPVAADLPFDPGALEAAREGRRVWITERWHGEPVRSLYYRPPDETGVLQIAAWLAPVRSDQEDLLFALIAVVVAGASAALVGAWTLAGSAVRPVQEITEQATHIEAGSLDRPIVAHADTEEYQGLVAVLNRMLDRLGRAFRSQRRLIADVGHELRTPLTAMRGMMEVALRAERTPRDYQRTMRSAMEEIDRLTEMSEDLLLVTRADARLIAPQRVLTDLNSLVREGLRSVGPRLVERELTTRTAFDPAVQPLLLDASLLGRAVGHLLDNAIKFTPIGGRIEVTTEHLPAGVRCTIQDSGPGFRRQDLPHIFEPFYRADEARTTGTGAGLGLTLVRAIVCLHGGTVRASNVNGVGARIELELPVAEAPRA